MKLIENSMENMHTYLRSVKICYSNFVLTTMRRLYMTKKSGTILKFVRSSRVYVSSETELEPTG